MMTMVPRLDAGSFFLDPLLSVFIFLALILKVCRNRFSCHRQSVAELAPSKLSNFGHSATNHGSPKKKRQWVRSADGMTGLVRAQRSRQAKETRDIEDGNGRIGRALSEKSLAQSLGQPSLIALAATILARRARYYAAHEAANKDNEITGWLAWFAGTPIEEQRRTLALIEFLIDKTKLLDRIRGQLNDRQEKALLRVFKEGPEGFEGGMSAGKYSTITGVSPATTIRDLADLTEKGVLIREGERRHARQKLNVPLPHLPHISVGEHGELIEQ
jgi:hypothetical protein